MSRNKQTIIGGALILAAASIIAKLIGMLYTIPLTGMLGEIGMAYYNSAYSLYNPIYTVALTGFPVATAKMIAAYSAEGRFDDVRRARKASSLLFAAVGISASVLMMLLAKPYVDYTNNPRALFCALAIAPSIFFGCLMATHRGYNQGLSNMTPTALSQIIEVLAKLVFSLVAAFGSTKLLNAEYLSKGTVFGAVMESSETASMTILSYSAAFAIFGVTFSCLVGYLFLAIRAKTVGYGFTEAQYAQSPIGRRRRYYVGQIFKLGVPIVLSSLVSSIMGLIDTMTIKRRLDVAFSLDPAAFLASHNGLLADIAQDNVTVFLYGAYTSIPSKLFALVPAMIAGIGMSALPHFSTLWEQNDRWSMHSAQRQVIRVTAFISAPLALGIFSLALPISNMLFPKLPVGALVMESATQLLGLAAVFAAVNAVIYVMFNAIGRVEIPLILTGVFAGVKIAWNYFLVGIPRFNILATAYGTLAVQILITAVSLILLRTVTGLRPQLWRNFGKCITAAALCGATAYATHLLLVARVGNTTATLVGVCAGAVVYLVCSILFRILTRSDVEGLPKGEKLAIILEKLGAFE